VAPPLSVRKKLPSSAPLGAIAVSTFGAVVAATMPLAVILSMPDISGGLSASADETSWITTLYNVGGRRH
jgi:MFS transporter, DHA2 family, multidrug resistance protein